MALVYHNHHLSNIKLLAVYNEGMSLFMKQDDTRSRLQQQIAAELQAKAKARAEEAELPDGVDDSRYIEGTKQSTRLAWVWIVIIIAVIAAAIVLVLISSR